MNKKRAITVARGDGIGPEIMDATLRVLEAAGAQLDIDEIDIGRRVYEAGHSTGITPEAWDSLHRTRLLLKAPITTPLGSGYKSVNVTIRKSLRLFANVRPCRAYYPYVPTNFPHIDMVIVRENEEDLYSGIEYQQSNEVVQALKLVSRPGCEAICRYALEYARAHGRKKVTCLTKSNIMKHTDGLFQQVFEEVAAEKPYADIITEHRIIDIGAALVAARPEDLDVVVTLNLYGDIVSDIAALVSGSVGLAGSANIGFDAAMFEAVHGSAPDIAGKDIANPSGLLTAAVMMLVHIGQPDVAKRVRNAWLRALEDGMHTLDIYKDQISTARLGTRAFADAVIERLGSEPQYLRPASFAHREIKVELSKPRLQHKRLVGVDVFLDWDEEGRDPDVLGRLVRELGDERLVLKLISNRGIAVYPDGMRDVYCTDQWRCRFMCEDEDTDLTNEDVIALLGRTTAAGLDFGKTELLYTFNGERGYSLGQGE